MEPGYKMGNKSSRTVRGRTSITDGSIHMELTRPLSLGMG